MKKVFKIYQTDFIMEDQKGHPENDYNFLLKLDDWEYKTVEDAEKVLQKHFEINGDTGEFTILPIYTKD